MGPFHEGELEVQRRAGVAANAASGSGGASTRQIPPWPRAVRGGAAVRRGRRGRRGGPRCGRRCSGRSPGSCRCRRRTGCGSPRGPTRRSAGRSAGRRGRRRPAADRPATRRRMRVNGRARPDGAGRDSRSPRARSTPTARSTSGRARSRLPGSTDAAVAGPARPRLDAEHRRPGWPRRTRCSWRAAIPRAGADVSHRGGAAGVRARGGARPAGASRTIRAT